MNLSLVIGDCHRSGRAVAFQSLASLVVLLVGQVIASVRASELFDRGVGAVGSGDASVREGGDSHDRGQEQEPHPEADERPPAPSSAPVSLPHVVLSPIAGPYPDIGPCPATGLPAVIPLPTNSSETARTTPNKTSTSPDMDVDWVVTWITVRRRTESY